ncbi:MAG: transposase family protein [Pseudomonadota bacterium]
MEIITSLFEKAIKLELTWQVKGVEFIEGKKVLNIFIDFPKGSVFACPKCGKPSKAYDTTEKRWRHLNFFQYECFFTARVPRIECEKDGILQAKVPWARSGADFTLINNQER